MNILESLLAIIVKHDLTNEFCFIKHYCVRTEPNSSRTPLYNHACAKQGVLLHSY